MKNTIFRFIALAGVSVIILNTSCQKDNVNLATSDESLKIVVNGGFSAADTKTTLKVNKTHWVQNDVVGVWSPEARTTSGGSTSIKNVSFSASTNGEDVPFTGTMYWGTGTHHFYSYYPRRSQSPSSYNSGVNGIWMVSDEDDNYIRNQVQTNDTSFTHLANYGVMVANPLSSSITGTVVSAPEGIATPQAIPITTISINFKYNQVLTLLKIKPILPAGSPNRTLTSLRITNTTSGKYISYRGYSAYNNDMPKIDITQTAPADGVSYTIVNSTNTRSNYVELTRSIGGFTITSDPATTATLYIMLLPGDYSADTFSFYYNFSSGTDITITKPGINMKRSYIYTVNMTVQQPV